jgi:hypothetical protein
VTRAGTVPFTLPGIDGNWYLNFGAGFQDPWNYLPSNLKRITKPGQILMHELTHVWQSFHDSWTPVFCDAVVTTAVDHNVFGEKVYTLPPPGTPWNRINLEAQGVVVDNFFVQTIGEADPTKNAYWPYIRDNIRTGQT